MNRASILQALDLSASAYRDVQPWSQNTCLGTAENASVGVQCYLRTQDDVLLITFRGTASPQGWKTDFAFRKKTIPYGNANSPIRVHSGFLRAYKAPGVRDSILRAVGPGIRSVKITGHSLGAALAVLCAVDIQYNFPRRDIEVVLFGCPRVGNQAFVRSYNQRVNKTVRVENGNDIVTRLPFSCMGFRHVGARLHIGCLRLPFFLCREDHYPVRYLEGLINGGSL